MPSTVGSIGILDTMAVPASMDWATMLNVSHISPETRTRVAAHSSCGLPWQITSRNPTRKTMRIVLLTIPTRTREDVPLRRGTGVHEIERNVCQRNESGNQAENAR